MTASLINFGSNSPALAGTLTVPAVNGVATFSCLSLNQPGTYTLAVTGNGIGGDATNPFDVTVMASQLEVTAQPPAAASKPGSGLAVSAEDALGNVDTSFNGSVTLALATATPAGRPSAGPSPQWLSTVWPPSPG